MAVQPTFDPGWLDEGVTVVLVSSLDGPVSLHAATDLLVVDDWVHESTHDGRYAERLVREGVVPAESQMDAQHHKKSGEARGSCCGHSHSAAQDHAGHGHQHYEDHAAATAVDPVCGMKVDPSTARHKLEHGGQTYYFCSERCRTNFEGDPAKYVHGKAEQGLQADVPAGTIYTCPMHPQIRQVGPGNCPICGMGLEAELATAETGPNPELIDMTRRFWVGLALSVPVVILEMGGHLVGAHGWIDQSLSNWIQFVLATPVVLWAGWPFFVRGWQSVVTRNLNMFTLIAMGIGIAWVYSIVATVVPGVFPATFRAHDGAVAVYFEAAAVITVLVLLGQVLELRAREATSGAIKTLLRPRSQDGAPYPRRWDRRRGSDRRAAGWRSAACPTRRKGAS